MTCTSAPRGGSSRCSWPSSWEDRDGRGDRAGAVSPRARHAAGGAPRAAGGCSDAGGGVRMAARRNRPTMPNLFGSGRFLFVVPPLAGHVGPTAAVGAELVRRGHDVAWAGPAEGVAPLLERGATLFPAEGRAPTERLAAAPEDWPALRFRWEEVIIPLG